MTDTEIELAVTKAGGEWNGDTWKFEDADLHPFVRRPIESAPPHGSLCGNVPIELPTQFGRLAMVA